VKIEELVILAKEAGVVLEEIRSSRTEGEILMGAQAGFVLAGIETHSVAIPYGPQEGVKTRENALTEAALDVRWGVVECRDSECEWCADSKAGVV